MSDDEATANADQQHLWEARLAVEIRNPDPGLDCEEGDDVDMPESARSQRLYAALDARQASNDGPWPTQIVRSDDAYAETSFVVVAEDRGAALRVSAGLADAALAEAEIDAGPVSIAVSAIDEHDVPDAEHGLESSVGEDAAAAVTVEPDEHYARGWWVDNPLAQGALKGAAMQILEELDDALHEVRHGIPVGDAFFVQAHLPAGFVPAYDERFLERFRICLVVVGYKLAQDPVIRLGCLAEELALAVIRSLAADLLEESDAGESAIGALSGVFEVCEDDDVLDLFDMEEPADAAVHGHDQISREMGKADMRVEAWFDPMWGGADGATPHPACR
jgi:hypothetical protein